MNILCHQAIAYLITKSKTKIYIACIIGFSLVWNLPKFFIYEWISRNGNYEVLPTQFSRSYLFRNVYVPWGHGIVQFFIPMTILIVLNTCLVRKVRFFLTPKINLGYQTFLACFSMKSRSFTCNKV